MWRMKLIFCLQINIKGFFKSMLWFFKYLKKEVSDEVNFLHADKHENFLQVDTIFWWSCISKVPEIASLQCLYNFSKKKLEMKLIFCMQINIKVFFKLISTLCALKFPTRWYYHYWWAWLSILKVVKVTSLQYLYNISEKKLVMEFVFLHADKRSIYKLTWLFFYRSG